MTLDQLKPIAKAITAAVIAGLGALSTALTDELVTGPEWITVAVATLTALGGTWLVPNTPADDMTLDEVEEQSVIEKDV